MRTISTYDLHDILKEISLPTLILYLNNYRFAKHRVTYMTGANARYYISAEFLRILFTYLIAKNRDDAAFNLQSHFKKYKIRPIDWEEFICESGA
jgi:hypothetical protein